MSYTDISSMGEPFKALPQGEIIIKIELPSTYFEGES
jgi:hypothetical protein